jgi:hypothetical protein
VKSIDAKDAADRCHAAISRTDNLLLERCQYLQSGIKGVKRNRGIRIVPENEAPCIA